MRTMPSAVLPLPVMPTMRPCVVRSDGSRRKSSAPVFPVAGSTARPRKRSDSVAGMRAILAPRYRRGMDTNAHEPAIRVSMLPRDTNGHGTIFGGILLAYIDQAGAIATRPFCNLVVTVKMNEVVFHAPVYVGDVVSFYAKVVKIGTTSITVKVTVTAERWREWGNVVKVTEAEVVYVNVGDDRRPAPIPARPAFEKA